MLVESMNTMKSNKYFGKNFLAGNYSRILNFFQRFYFWIVKDISYSYIILFFCYGLLK